MKEDRRQSGAEESGDRNGLKELLEQAAKLVAAAQQNCRELDQLWASRKDALSEGRLQAAERGAANDVALRWKQPAEALARPPSPRQPTQLLLVVEDDQNDFDLLHRALRKQGVSATVRRAKDGTEAIEVLSYLEPEVAGVCVVSDIGLGKMSGFELLRSLRTLGLRVPTRFVFLTGNTRPSIEADAYASGADAFFTKACGCESLVKVAQSIQSLLNRGL
jgi:CheY-like chemotaxis protein